MILVVVGTRPEAIKLAPVILGLRSRAADVQTIVCLTRQHAQLVDDVLATFSIVPDHDLNTMTPGQSLNALAARILAGIEPILAGERPHWVVVQGDTTTTLMASIAAFHVRVPIAHVEAGLRSFDLRHPFPEEANRRIVTSLAAIHFAPTETARARLLAERVAGRTIYVTGNPGLDALRLATEGSLGELPVCAEFEPGRRLVLVTAHRRESFGAPLRSICDAVARIALEHPDSVRIVFPVHPNPRVDGPVRERLAAIPNVTLLAPRPYLEMVALLRRAYLILTDSGGLQEEATALGTPVLVMRHTTERPEAVEAGGALLVGRGADAIVARTLELLRDPVQYERMAVPRAVFGDGHSSERIAAVLIDRLRGGRTGE